MSEDITLDKSIKNKIKTFDVSWSSKRNKWLVNCGFWKMLHGSNLNQSQRRNGKLSFYDYETKSWNSQISKCYQYYFAFESL